MIWASSLWVSSVGFLPIENLSLELGISLIFTNLLIDWMNSEGIHIAFFSNLKFRSLSAKVNNARIV